METTKKLRIQCIHEFTDTISCLRFIPANHTFNDIFVAASWDGTVIYFD